MLIPPAPHNHASLPVYKVGAVILRRDREPVEILIVQPRPKRAGEIPPFVLPRGSRQYAVTDANGMQHFNDVRDDATAQAQASALEPITATLAREMAEEAGMTADDLAAAQVMQIGPMPFHSKTKGVYPVHWFVIRPTVLTANRLTQSLPVDAMAIHWVDMHRIHAMLAEGIFSPGYLPVIETALTLANG